MQTLSQLRSLCRSIISQPDPNNSDFPLVGGIDSEMNDFANQAVRFTAVKVEYPRDHVQMPGQVGIPVYPLPSDFLNIIEAYYGDPNQVGNINNLKILQEKELAQIRPSWMGTSQSSWGIPDVLMMLDRKNILLSPTPDANNSQPNNYLFVTYTYYPALLQNDGDVPDLPQSFQDILPIYMAHLCYLGKLNNPKQADALFKEYLDKIKLIEMQSTREKDQMNFFWAFAPGLDGYNLPDIVVTKN